MALMDDLKVAFKNGWLNYNKTTSGRIKLCDIFMIFFGYLAVMELLYVIMVGSFPFNSFLSGFFAAVGSLTLTGCLRLQLSYPQSFHHITAERALADWMVCNLVLHVACINFLG